MAESQEPVRIAVNVMRARLTVLGFNLAVIAFQINELSRAPGATRLPNLSDSVHIEADAVLFMAFALSMIAIIAYIASSAYDREGTCTPWLLVAGDLLMYLGLAHTIAGFFGPYIRALDAVALEVPAQAVAYATVRTAMLVAGGGAWFLATYLGPTVCLLRSPCGRAANLTLAAAYLVALLALSAVSMYVARSQAEGSGSAAGPMRSLLTELVQPVRW
jgi:hypothetical protein